uniref:G protein-coupled receptor n=1 Tax=Ditylenchus dipsaci TaxID=166011 RepID=A0A915CVY4_9BILA
MSSHLKAYKITVFILLNSTNAVLFDVLSTLFHPEFLLPYPIIMVGGVMRDVHLGDTVTHILSDNIQILLEIAGVVVFILIGLLVAVIAYSIHGCYGF